MYGIISINICGYNNFFLLLILLCTHFYIYLQILYRFQIEVEYCTQLYNQTACELSDIIFTCLRNFSILSTKHDSIIANKNWILVTKN